MPLFENETGDLEEYNFWYDGDGEVIRGEFKSEDISFGDGDLAWIKPWGKDVFFARFELFDKVSRLLVATNCAVDIRSLWAFCDVPLKLVVVYSEFLLPRGLLNVGIPVA